MPLTTIRQIIGLVGFILMVLVLAGALPASIIAFVVAAVCIGLMIP